MGHKIAVGSIFTECNHFRGAPMTLHDFERNELRRGDAVLSQHTGTVGGMLQVLRAGEHQIVPLIVASTCPGGPISAACYQQLKSELLERLRNSLPVSGVLLSLHGAATAENADDVEGDLIAAVRQLVGEQTSIVATLDLHAHVTETMVRDSDALVAWETYPHRDAFSTGERGARLLIDILDGRCRPTMAMAKVPVMVTAIHGGTEMPGPFAWCMQCAKQLEQSHECLSSSMFLVHPYLDLPDMGGGGLVITDNDPDAAVRLAKQLAREYWLQRENLEPTLYSPAAAIRMGLQTAGGPVLLVEAADCCGGGAAGDSIATLRALVDSGAAQRALVPVVDPAAAALCHRSGVGSRMTLTLGHQVDPQWGKPLEGITGEVIRLSDGRFRYTGGIWDGQAGNMGDSAVFRIGNIDVLIATHATYDWNDEQFQLVGMDAREAKFVVVKNPMNYHMAYGSFAKQILVLDTPGPTPATLRHLNFRRLQRPWFPLDTDLIYFPADSTPSREPVVYQARARR